MFENIPQPVNQIYQKFTQDDQGGPGAPDAGGAAIIVYAAQETARQAFAIVLDGMGATNEMQEIGEVGQIKGDDLNSEALFLRCTTVVHIQVIDNSFINVAKEFVTRYAQMLDERLMELVCQ